MKAKNTIRESRTDWGRLDAMSDSDIDVSDVAKLDKAFFERAQVRLPKRKSSISLRVDPDVLEWFKHQGRGYQTRINAVLKAYVHAHQH
ncbi:MAG: BrnA antitoxin family protein [Lentisphaerae bacterium]|nr:BrnA antitoxin family protein [Lentisphaerota bacterium]